jgi:hypothetical protein
MTKENKIILTNSQGHKIILSDLPGPSFNGIAGQKISIGKPSKLVANLIGLEPRFLNMTLYAHPSKGRDHYYSKKYIPKRNGNPREINAISGRLRTVQKKTLDYLQSNFSPTAYAKGFVPGGGIIENAKVHRNKKLLIKLDLEDFFPNITFARVLGMFQAYPFKFSKEVAVVFTQICCMDDNGPIPQGGVTSPYISNMICRKLDSRLSKYAKLERISYSRYADDLTFSTNKSINNQQFLGNVNSIILDESFIVNDSKTKILPKSKRQIVTGIVVNDGLNVSRRYISSIRALLHNCYKYGIKSQLVKSNFKNVRNTCSPIIKISNNKYQTYRNRSKEISTNDAIEIFLNHISGRIRFVGQVAEANFGLNEVHYHQRIKIYNKLLEKLSAIIVKEKISGYRLVAIQKEIRDCQNIDLINKVKSFTNDELDNLVNTRSISDPRFFTTSYSADLEIYRKQVASLLSYPLFNGRIYLNLLSNLKKSTSILGGLVHDVSASPHSRSDIINFVSEFNIKMKYYLPYSIRKIFFQFLSGVEKEVFENRDSENFNLFSDDNFRTKYANKFKQLTRFGRSDEKSCTIINTTIKKICNSIKSDINIEVNIKVHSFYTDVNVIKESIRLILLSMVRNTKSKSLYIEISRDVYDRSHCIYIYDKNYEEVEIECSRDKFAHGKIKEAIRLLNGIGQYYFIANFKNIGWKKIDLLHGDKIIDVDESNGVTHLIKLPEVI